MEGLFIYLSTPGNVHANLLSYGGEKTIKNGIINAFVQGARLSWVDVEDVAEIAAMALAHPELHGGQTYRLGYDAASFGELAEKMTAIMRINPLTTRRRFFNPALIAGIGRTNRVVLSPIAP